MNDPLADSLLSKFLLQQSVLVAEQFHGEFVVRRLEQSYQLIAKVVSKIRRFGDRRAQLFLRRSVQTYVIACNSITREFSTLIFICRLIWVWGSFPVSFLLFFFSYSSAT